MNTGHFPPPKRRGMIVHGVLILVLAVIAIAGFISLSRTTVGPSFLISLLVAFIAFIPLPFLAYRTYSLLRADYHMDRDSLAIYWGLRVEDIPLTDIEWIRPAEDLTRPLSLPALPLPGSLLGLRRHPDLGVVEFLASDVKKLLLVATAKRVFVISPENPSALAQTFARATELGSLAPAEAKSVYPSFVVSQACVRRRTLSLADNLIPQPGSLHLGKSHHPQHGAHRAWSAVRRERARHRPIFTAHHLPGCQPVACRDRLDRRLILLSLGKRTCASLHHLGFEHAYEFAFSVGSAVHYYNSCVTFNIKR